MKTSTIIFILSIGILLSSCTTKKSDKKEFKYFSEHFADLQVLRYQIPDFNKLDLKQKEMIYYLYQAGLVGRDIYYDQNYKHNLFIRRTLEEIVKYYTGNRNTEEFNNFMTYIKRIWFSNGIHHHYSTIKFDPGFTQEYFIELIKNSPGGKFMLGKNEVLDDLINKITPLIFDMEIDSKRINLDRSMDLVTGSANNYYENVTQAEVEQFYDKIINKNDSTPISYGLNSKLVKEHGIIKEKVWKLGGMYSQAIEKIIYWLEKASSVAENDLQKNVLKKLSEYYQTGDLKIFDEYNILWVQDTLSHIDLINGFIEVYGDPLAFRGAYESIIAFKDVKTTKRIKTISKYAQWFEDHSPIKPEHKKEKVKGISGKVITVISEVGESSPDSPIGILLPNSNWIRTHHGSKSVGLGNIVHSLNEADYGSGFIEEFAYSEEEVELYHKYSVLSTDLHTDMHEVIGHASGKLNPGVGTPKETLKNYSSILEEARADLVALYFIMDQKLIEIGVMPDLDVARNEYNNYIRNGLMTQLKRLQMGEQLEQAHMRNRQMISKWVFNQGKKDNVIEKKIKDGKTYFVINDYTRLRELFGQLLQEIQRIKSEGDYNAGASLVESYGIKIDPDLHKEVLERYNKLNIAPYSGFINPVLKPVIVDGKIVDITVEYPDDFTAQMLFYAQHYSFLPTYN